MTLTRYVGYGERKYNRILVKCQTKNYDLAI